MKMDLTNLQKSFDILSSSKAMEDRKLKERIKDLETQNEQLDTNNQKLTDDLQKSLQREE